MKLLYPLPTGRRTDGFSHGRAAIPGVIDAGPHYGQDWAAEPGTPIRSAHAGVVRLNYHDRKGGWMVIIAGDGFETSYQHMRAKSRLTVGQYVHAGIHVGNVGSSGASTGPHLHFEVWIGGRAYLGGRAIDPLTVIRNEITKIETYANTHSSHQWEEEDDDMKPTIHYRTDGGGEYTRCHPDIGKTLQPGQSRKDGNVTVYRGFEATANKTVGTAWARQYAGGSGNEHSRTDRAGYMAIQQQATRLSVAVHG